MNRWLKLLYIVVAQLCITKVSCEGAEYATQGPTCYGGTRPCVFGPGIVGAQTCGGSIYHHWLACEPAPPKCEGKTK